MSFTCPDCGRTSHHPEDERSNYCGNCHEFKDDAPMVARPITAQESRRIGAILGDPFVAFGHPLTCNGGNRDLSTHHDHEVRMRIDGDDLVCPECGRVQPIPE